MQKGKTWATSNIQIDPHLPKTWLPAVKKQDYHGLLCVPLIRKGKIISGMCIYYKDIHKFEYFEMRIVTIVANQAATALANARIFGDLRIERNKTLSIIQSLNDGLIMYDLEGRVIFFNPKAEEFLWIKWKNIIGKEITERMSKKSIYLKNLYRINHLLKSDYETKEYMTEGPQRMVLQIIQIPVRDQKDKKIGLMHILHDITREKEIEQLKTSFVSIASHQLRTPLSGLKWSLHVLLDEERGPLREEQSALLTKMFDTNEHLIKIVDDLLNVSRIEERRFGYSFVLGDITKPIHKVISNLQANADKGSIILTFKKPKELMPKVSFDGNKIDLAIQNVVDNAIKYTLSGGVVNITLKEEKRFLFIVIKDNGIGIPKKDQKFIFNKFFRAANAMKLQTEGSGLGLFIAKSIVEKHRGAISFISEENKGSTFMIRFPLDSPKMPKG